MFVNPSYTLVAINYWPEPTGNAPYNSDLAQSLAKISDVRVVTGIPHYPWWKKQANHSDLEYLEANENVSLFRLNHIVPKRHSNFTRALMEIDFGLRTMASGKLAGQRLILASPAMISSAMTLAWVKMRFPKTKVIVWVQDLYEQGLNEISGKPSILSKLVISLENWMLANADRVVFAHPGFLAAKNIDISESEKFRSVGNWSQFKYDPAEQSSSTRAKYGVTKSKVVLHIGNLGVKQGLINVLSSANLAQEKSADIQFVFVGGGNQLDSIKRTASKLGLSNFLIIPPVSEVELSNLLNMADIFLVHEQAGVKEMSIPSKLTTYFLAGKPVLVCSDKDSLAAKTVLDHGIGFWVKSGDPIALLSRIETLELEKSKKVSKAARIYAEENMGKNQALAKLISIINEV